MGYKQIIISVFALLIHNGICAQGTETLSQQFLEENVVPIKSIDPSNKDFQDLQFLKAELKAVEMVMLGEQGHGDGSTLLAKTRLIKFLHEQMGYNVIAFESGLADAYRVWNAIQDGADSLAVFDLGIFPVWVKSVQAENLFKYILAQSKTNTPLIIAGFDIQPTGSLMSPAQRLKELNDYLAAKVPNVKMSDYKITSEVFKNPQVVIIQPFSDEKKDQFHKEINDIQTEILKSDKSIKGKVMALSVKSIYQTVQLYMEADFQNPSNTPHIFNMRDKEMAANFKMLKEEMYPGEKIIAWGANSHFGYARGLLGGFDSPEAPETSMEPMGQYLKIDYLNKLYSIAFTSYEGKYGMLSGDVFEHEPAKKGTIENQLQAMEHPYAFLSLRNKELLGKRFATVIYGHTEMTGVWTHMADGLFFISYMEENQFRK